MIHYMPVRKLIQTQNQYKNPSVFSIIKEEMEKGHQQKKQGLLILLLAPPSEMIAYIYV